MIIKRLINKLFPLRVAIKNGMKVGKGLSLVSPHSVLFGTEPYLIKIGNYVRISGNVSFITHDGGTWVFRHEDSYKHVFKYGTITVGDNVFIGAQVIIMPNVSIGNRCVIGAGSVVTKNVPSGSVVAGVPARVICTIEKYIEKCINSIPNDINLDLYYSDKKNELSKKYWREQ